MTTTRTSLRRTPAAAAALLALTLTACGGEDSGAAPEAQTSTPSTPAEESTPADEPTSEDSEPEEAPEEATALPTKEELASVLLTTADLPEGFTVGPEDDDDDSSFKGTCLEDVGDFTEALGTEAATEAEVELVTDGAAGPISVSSGVKAFESDDLASAFVEFSDTLMSCTSIETTDDDGITYSLEVVYDGTVELPGADEALGIELSGTASAGAESFDLEARFVAGVFGPLLSNVGTFAVGGDTTGVLDAAEQLAVLQAQRVTDGLG